MIFKEIPKTFLVPDALFKTKTALKFLLKYCFIVTNDKFKFRDFNSMFIELISLFELHLRK